MTTKRAYKLQEFVAHSSSVNCLKIGRKSSRVLVTGGEDHKVNLWAIGKPNAILSLSGHTSRIDSVSFDSSEVLVAAGAASGTIKLWDLEEAKIVRTLTGHRSNCISVDFHPFGEFFASGSLDTNLKIWDIRKKGCIHTYKGHTRGVNTIRFTPDGRWVVSGGEDNIVKVWDLTAGKLLHDFKYHEGQIQCLDFHPHEFLLATGGCECESFFGALIFIIHPLTFTGSADRTVKFWDLETFELIGSAGPEVLPSVFDDAHVQKTHRDTYPLESLKGGRTRPVVLNWEKRGRSSNYDGPIMSVSPKNASMANMPSVNVYKQRGYPASVEKEMPSASDGDAVADLMEQHDQFISSMQSRLAKLQAVHRYWERKDIKGAIGAIEKMADHAVLADVMSIVIEKMDIVTLDICTCLLPLLSGLLGSDMDRHLSICLDMLLKLVRVFGSMIYSTISASTPVGVDIEAEQRFERCNLCFIELEKVKRCLPTLTRRGGSVAKSSQELNLALQEVS
ncbi:hypothetical protein GOBAR_AA40196 [Gossypium barbadense]|uniref:Katanin p80 WD40 repeat-containing subunit B1 homolog n=1 Tax=Gossypium barbadense TaxID=3634 RepID=A0A2P5VNV1_GOSBA|nr:hypothetical protein GOBAR_AA40196 [Gossypium barbadense]